MFLNQSRIGNNYNPANQSLAGMMARLGGGLTAVHSWWVVAALVTGAGGLAIAHDVASPGPATGRAGLLRAHRRAGLPHLMDASLGVGDPAAGGHGRDRLAAPVTGLGLAAVALFTAFSGLDPMPWPGRHPSLFRTVEGNLYALCGLAVLGCGRLVDIPCARWVLRPDDPRACRYGSRG